MVTIYVYGTTKGDIGIYSGPGDERNYNDKVKKTFRTRYKAEIIACIIALESAGNSQDVVIMSKSKYVTQGMTRWIKRWKHNGWVGYKGEPVVNKDLFMRLLMLENRIIDNGHHVTWINVQSYEPAMQSEKDCKWSRKNNMHFSKNIKHLPIKKEGSHESPICLDEPPLIIKNESKKNDTSFINHMQSWKQAFIKEETSPKRKREHNNTYVDKRICMSCHSLNKSVYYL